MNQTKDNIFFNTLRDALTAGRVLTDERSTRRYRKGIRVGNGAACAVALPNTLVEFWHALEACVAHNKIILVQAANTGLTGGSTPDGDDYDRDVVIINTRRLDKLILLDQGKQVIALAGATLFQLEDKLKPLKRSPHSIIGSSCIGASIVGGVCNNSGGNLVNRGPAYTEMALFAEITTEGKLQLINNLGITLGGSPEQILSNLENGTLKKVPILATSANASDYEYQQRVRDVNAKTPARFNADKRRLHDASGCAGKLAVFAVRLDTFTEPQQDQVFYIGTNNPEEFTELRKRILTQFKELPEMGEYMHRSYFDGADKYCKDTFLFINLLGSSFLPKLFSFKAKVDSFLGRIPFLPNNLSDRFLQLTGKLYPDHLPKRLREYRKRFEHHLMVKANDGAIAETRQLLQEYYGADSSSNSKRNGEWFTCTDKEGDAAQLHRFVAGGASARYAIVHADEVEGLMPLDVALPRNTEDWHQLLSQEVLDKLAAPFQLSHFFCMVFHWDFVVKKGVDIPALKRQILNELDSRGAKYPAEHNVGHLYQAEPDLANFYQNLDPTNSFNAGVGKMSKRKYYKTITNE
ncbi:D-lactate dehydrogenase [Amphritea japonica]|uniref:Quinone-dependent D-lactate dehydrogenase n=1 Tax=Amphritea japonica ATCC BAA-1530 TaxID=1278309 RepID=A0A7R6PBS0_9GAMM|nr:D-lactate dehydrogenase [Amphritea japonica]BBB27112.1 D-lactate dehydrogenase [Amphritea japonica ATCC BAA-1530]